MKIFVNLTNKKKSLILLRAYVLTGDITSVYFFIHLLVIQVPKVPILYIACVRPSPILMLGCLVIVVLIELWGVPIHRG